MHRDSSSPSDGGGIDLSALLAAFARELAPHVARALGTNALSASAAPSPLLDKRELARVLSVSPATVDRLDAVGQPFIRVGDAKRYDLATVLAWHRERTESAKEEQSTPNNHSLTLSPAAEGDVRMLSRRSAT